MSLQESPYPVVSVGEIEALRAEVSHLRAAMQSRATIEQAKGMVMMRYGLSADSAFLLLLRWSCEQNLKLRLVAAAVIDHGRGEGDNPPQSESTSRLRDLHEGAAGHVGITDSRGTTRVEQ